MLHLLLQQRADQLEVGGVIVHRHDPQRQTRAVGQFAALAGMQIGQQRQQTRGGDRFGDTAVNAAHLKPIRQQHHGARQRQQHAVGAVEQGVDKGVVQQLLLRDVDR